MTSQRKVNFRGNLTSTSTKLALFVAFNAMVVHEVLASLGSAKPLSMRPGTVSLKDWLVDQWGTILRDVNYEPVFDLAVRVLKSIPSHPIIETMLRNLIGIAASIVSSKALLKHDIAGRIYHTLLLKDVAKGLATYYTSIPGAYLLAKLAIKTRDFESFLVGENEPYVIADLACGSGTLLSASYSSVLDTWIQRRLEKGGEISSEEQAEFHKTMLEKILYGFDVLEYAVHLAAAWLTVRMPEVAVREMNVYTLPLGREVDNTWLGSLSIRTDSQDVCTVQMATSLTGEESGAKAGGLVRKMKTPIKMPRPRLVIMNPPFARTGNVGHSILMGHLPDSERKVVLAALREYLNSAKRSLGGAIGKAGLAASFVWLAHRALSKDGRMALVLPRVALSGPSWEPIRNLLVRDYAINHVVVSYDPEHQWAWSENTDLSETLLVCTRRKNSEESVKVSYVYRRPRSALEAKVLASRILESNPKAGIEESIILGRDPIASVYELPQERLRKSRNWNTCTALASSKLSNITYKIHSENNIYGIPLIPLADSVETLKTQGSLKDELNIGYDVATYQRCKDAHGNLILDVLEGANVSTLNMLNVSPNATARFKEECSDLQKRKSNFLIAGVARFWLYTVGLSSVFCSRPVISNTMWTIGLKGKQPDENAKVQVLWLNSTLGLLNILGLRQDSKGAFVQFKKEYLPLLKLVDFTKIKKKQRDDLLVLFKKLANDTVPSLPEQLRQGLNTRGFRWRLDSEFLRIVAPSFNITLVADLYERLLRETIINKNARPIQS